MTKLAFISHASEDAAVAQIITDYLERNGISCWIAPRDADPGSDYSSEIIEGIESSAVFVLVLSENANESAFVKRKVERAVSKGKPVFPIRVREVLPSKALELFISYRASIEFSGTGTRTDGPEGCPLHLAINPNLPTPFTCSCSAAAARTETWFVAGTDFYTDISNLCRAAVHAGAITTKGGPITVVRSEGREYYVGSSRNGVQTADFGSYRASIEFSGTGTRTDGPEGCPLHLAINPNLPTPFTCSCSAAAARTETWFVAGTDFYTDISNLCRAAVHAGAITTKGGPITVVRSEGREYYVGSSRNGVQTADFGSYRASISFN